MPEPTLRPMTTAPIAGNPTSLHLAAGPGAGQGITNDLIALVRRLAAAFPGVEVAPIPLADWREGVLARYRTKAATTRYRIDQAMREAIELAGPGATTAGLSAELVERFASNRPDRAAKTTNDLLGALRAACNLAVASGSLGCSPFGPSTPWSDSDEPPRRRHHSRGEIARVLDQLDHRSAASWGDARLHALVATLAYAGLRKTEALRLKAQDVDLDRRIITVRRNGRRLKTRASAAPVPMAAPLVEVLGRWLPRSGSTWVFPGSRRVGPWLTGMVGKRPTCQVVAAGRLAGVADFTPQSLRRSLATHLAGSQGLSAKQIQMVLRHANQTTQRWYIHDDLSNLAAMMGGFDYAVALSPTTRPGPRPSLI